MGYDQAAMAVYLLSPQDVAAAIAKAMSRAKVARRT